MSLLDTINNSKPKTNSGGQKVQNYLLPTQKAMIQKRKQQRKKELENGKSY